MQDSFDQIEAMRQGVNYTFPVTVRGFQIHLRPLSVFEVVKMTADVAEEMRRVPESARNKLTEHTILAKKTIVMASTSDVGQNDPKITEMVLERMTTDELHFLFKGYNRGCDRVNPALEKMSESDINQLVDTLKKSQLTQEELGLALTELSFSQLLNLVRHFLATSGD